MLYRSFYLYTGIAFPFTVNAAAVLLTVYAKSFGNMATVRIALAQVGIQKIPTAGFGDMAAHFTNEVMLLVRTDEQSGSKGIKATIGSHLRRFTQAKLKAMLATLSFISRYPAKIVDYIIAIDYAQR